MKVQLQVPNGAVMSYQLAADVHEIVCTIGERARLTVLHAPGKPQILEQSYIIQSGALVQFYGTYELAIESSMLVILQGEYAQADIKIGFKGDASSVAHIKTEQRHEAIHTASSLLCKGILSDAAQLSHTGTIYVAEHALHTNAKLFSNHILKDAKSYAHVQPNLQVLTDAVQCAHGSAIGMFDQQMLLYMATRGLDSASAQQLLEEAFFAEVRLD